MRDELALTLFGSPEVRLHGRPVTGFRSSKAQALLYYLAVTARPHTRSTLAGLLWGDQPEAAARASLSKCLSNLHDLVGDAVMIERQTIAFNRNCAYQLDTERFAAGGDAPPTPETLQPLHAALALYRGDFLEGFYVRDAPDFEQWVLVQRAYYRETIVQGIHALAAFADHHGDLPHAIAHTRRLLALEPWREEAHRQLMLLLARSGQRAAALAQFEICRTILDAELAVEPDAETLAVVAAIRSGDFDKVTEWQDDKLNAVQDHPVTLSPPHFVTSNLPISPTPLSGGAAPLNQLLLETDPSVFVTRTHALARLDMFLDASRAGQGQLVFITGEAGSGKTALAYEFARRAQATSADLIVVSGTCNAHTGAGEPYLPFREILELLTCDRNAHLTSGLFSAVQAQRLWALFPATLTAFVEEGTALINTFVSAQTLLNRTRTLASSSVPITERLERLVERSGPIAMNQHDLFRHYTAVLTILAAQQPLLLILDDLQWADTASINLLFHLGQRISGSRILLIGMYRPDDVAIGRDGERHPLEQVVHEGKRYHGDIELDIDRAAAEEGQQFVDALLDNEPNRLGAAFRAALYRQTAGHPLFTVELVRGMQARGDLVRDADDYWIEGPALEWDVLPARVEGVIAERIGRLSEELQDALAVASVEGETFTAEVIAHVLAVDNRGLVQRLSGELDRHHLLIRSHGTRRVGGQRLSLYQFRHFLFQKYLYQRLDAGERGYLHEAVVKALEVLHAGSTEEIAAQLARHYEESGALEQAITYLRQVGERAHQLYANQEAIDAFQHALDLLHAAPSAEYQQPQWQAMFTQLSERLGDILHPIGRPGDARSAYEHALSRIPKHDRIWHARLHRKIGSTYDAQAHYEAALHDFNRAESTLGPQPTDPTIEWWQEWMWLQQARLGVYYDQGQWREMNALIGTVQPIIERYGTPEARARFFLNVALMLMRRDRYVVSAETLAYGQAALTAGQATGDVNQIALYQFNLGFGHLWRDEFDVAEPYMQTALTTAERIDDMWVQAACLTYLTHLYRRRRQIDDVRRLNVRVLAAAERGQYAQYIGMAKANLAWIAWCEGDFAVAQVHGDAALEIWQQSSVDYPFQWAARLPLIGVALAQQQLTEALAYTRGLLGATQQPLSEALMVRIEAAIQAGEAVTQETVRTQLEHVIADAQALGYL